MASTPSCSVLHVASGDLWAGAEVQLFMLARAQLQLGARVAAILLNEGELSRKMQNAGVQVFVFSEREHSILQLLHKAREVMRRLRPDVVHTHRLKENLIGAVAGRLCSIPSVRTVHGAAEFSYQRLQLAKRLVRAVDTWIGTHLQDRIIAVTPELRENLARVLPARKLTAIENGIDPDTFAKNDAIELDSTFVRARRRVGIVGRLVPVKRVDLFLQCAARLRSMEEFADVEFFVIGEGPLREQLEASSNAAHFLGMQSPVHPYLAQLDALVICSDHEGLPMTLLEAMALGVPVVAHEVGGMRLVLEGGRCGWTVSDHSGGGYTEALIAALTQIQEARERARAALERVRSLYSAQRCAQRHLALYGEVIATR